MPVTTSSGAGFAGIETSFMGAGGCGAPPRYSRTKIGFIAKRPGTGSMGLVFNGFRALQLQNVLPISRLRRPAWLRTGSRFDHSVDRPHVAQTGGYAMRTFDLAPLYRSTVGFDRLFN